MYQSAWIFDDDREDMKTFFRLFGDPDPSLFKLDIIKVLIYSVYDDFWDQISKNYSACQVKDIISILGLNSSSVTKTKLN